MLNRSYDAGSDNNRPCAAASTRALRRCITWSLIAVWTAAVATGIGFLAVYANSPGKWSPAPSRIERDAATSSRHRLMMFLHPRCPCSFASVNELTRIISRCGAQLETTVYFVRPASKPADWENGPLRDLVTSIPGVSVKSDVGGTVANQYHANTSGEVLVYDHEGNLCFHGGITSARGHDGDNLGESAVIAIALGEKSNVERCPVFGCPFHAEVADNRN